MQNLNLRFVNEAYDDNGLISEFSLKYPENFNFGYDIVDELAVTDPDRRAMVWCNPEGEEHTFTFGEMKYFSDKTANYLSNLGIGRGDKVLVILRRHYQFWFVATALHKLGAVIVPATFMLKEHDFTYRANSCSAKAVICTDVGDIAQTIDNCIHECPTIETRILLNAGGGGTTDGTNSEFGEALSGAEGICKLRTSRDGWADLNEGIVGASSEFARRETLAHEGAILYFSSGTTGNAKMVMHDYTYGLAHTFTAKHWHNVVSDGGLHFTIADTGWGKAVWGKYYGQWTMEACVFTYDFDRFVPAEMLQLIEKYKVTTFCAPPTMYRFMIREGLENFDLSSLTYCTTAGEALNPDVFESWREGTGIKLAEGFGQTETVVTICNTPGMEPRPGSMGKPTPQYRLELLDEDGEPCAPGATGEICLACDPHPDGLMLGYYRDQERTDEAMYDGWYHSGDLAWMDEDGYFWYVGRNDDVIKSSGYRIGPFEVESVLLEHPAVSECAVTAVPDEIRGYAVKATVVLSAGYDASEELTKELQTYVKTHTAPYKFPRIIDYVEALPKTVNGKIRRAEIRARG